MGMDRPPKVARYSREDEEVLIERTKDCPGSCAYEFPYPLTRINESTNASVNRKLMAFDFGYSDHPSSSSRRINGCIFFLDLTHPTKLPSHQYPLNILVKNYQKNDDSVSKVLELTQETEFEIDVTDLVNAWQNRPQSDLVLVVMVKDKEGSVVDANEVFKRNNNTQGVKNFRSHMLKIILSNRV